MGETGRRRGWGVFPGTGTASAWEQGELSLRQLLTFPFSPLFEAVGLDKMHTSEGPGGLREWGREALLEANDKGTVNRALKRTRGVRGTPAENSEIAHKWGLMLGTQGQETQSYHGLSPS